jgi:DNA-directed RNA polymerase subunit RPC12/RpoP
VSEFTTTTVDDDEGNVISIEVTEAWRRRYAKDPKAACAHSRIRLDRILAEVQCRDCEAKINPVEWIAMAAESWKAVQRMYDRQKEAARELDLKRRAKCQHCGRISEVRHPSPAEVRAWDEQERSRKIKSKALIVVDPAGGGERK